MSTLKDRPNTALLVIDVQKGVMDSSINSDEVIENINSLVDKARAADVPVVWIQHESDDLPLNSDKWQLAPGLKSSDDEPHVGKKYGDSFEDTNLESVLNDLGVGHLVVSGAQTDACVRSTLHGAIARGYDALLVSDAHTTEDMTRMGCAAAGTGDRAHQSLLVVSEATGPESRHRDDRRGQLRQRCLIALCRVPCQLRCWSICVWRIAPG